jgi:hypothetical protein
MAESRLYKIAHPQSFAIWALFALFKPATLPDHAIIESDQRVISQPAIVLYVRHPHNQILASSGLSESCPKIGDVPKSPFHTVAALVPSAGIIILQIELHSRMRVP